MIPLPASVRVYLCLSACDMRKSFDSLHALVRDHLELDAYSGHLVIFASRRRIEVTPKDQKALDELLGGGVQQVRVVLRAVALLQLAKGISAPRVAGTIPLTPQAIRKVGHRYQEGGLERALYEKQRPGAAELLEDSQKQRIIAMVCSDPPEGHARWTVRLVREEAVKRKLVPRVGRETIRILLLRHDLKPWREKNVVHRRPQRRLHRQDGRRSEDL